jgi:hypothetical protein
MRRLAFLAVPLLASCGGDLYHYPEEFSQYYRTPAEETTGERIDRREIWYWPANPKEARRIGYLFRRETLVQGSREPRECSYIYDSSGTRALGFITAENAFYRFRSDGQLGEPIGDWDLRMGLKVFFGYDISHHIDLREIDPYK